MLDKIKSIWDQTDYKFITPPKKVTWEDFQREARAKKTKESETKKESKQMIPQYPTMQENKPLKSDYLKEVEKIINQKEKE